MKRSFRLSDIKPDPRRDVSDELKFHLEMRTQEFIAQGMSSDDARRAALAAFGDVSDVEATLRDERSDRAREHLRRDWRRGVTMDVTYALRTLRRSLGFILVNEEAARRYWPGASALGKRIFTGFIGPNAAQDIIGIVRDARQLTLDTPVAPAIYMPVTQIPYPFLTFVVRTKGDDPAAALPLMRRELKAMDPALALNEVQSLRSVVDTSLARQRFSMIVIGVFAGAALALAMIGLYGVIAYSVAQRTREIGVRMALGARPRDVLALIVGEGARVTAAGVVVGLAVAFGATRLMRSLLYDVSATDVGIYALVAVITAAVAVLASYVPARRATRVSPTTALREG
jgi:putative ABC transport system permease protein